MKTLFVWLFFIFLLLISACGKDFSVVSPTIDENIEPAISASYKQSGNGKYIAFGYVPPNYKSIYTKNGNIYIRHEKYNIVGSIRDMLKIEVSIPYPSKLYYSYNN